jgi:fluoroquinolone transport system permease protein
MSRLAAALRYDARLQWRYGLYLVGALIAAFFSLLLSPLDTAAYGFALPAFIVGNITTTTFFFVAVLVLFEKQEGSLTALCISPLRTHEYLLSKVLSLAFLAIAETGVMIAFVFDGSLSWPLLLFGMLALCAVFTLVGFITVVRFASITDFLLPAVLVVIAMELPLLGSLGVVPSNGWLLFPIGGPLELLAGAVAQSSPWAFAAALASSACWIAILAALCQRAFLTFVSRAEGSTR